MSDGGESVPGHLLVPRGVQPGGQSQGLGEVVACNVGMANRCREDSVVAQRPHASAGVGPLGQGVMEQAKACGDSVSWDDEDASGAAGSGEETLAAEREEGVGLAETRAEGLVSGECLQQRPRAWGRCPLLQQADLEQDAGLGVRVLEVTVELERRSELLGSGAGVPSASAQQAHLEVGRGAPVSAADTLVKSQGPAEVSLARVVRTEKAVGYPPVGQAVRLPQQVVRRLAALQRGGEGRDGGAVPAGKPNHLGDRRHLRSAQCCTAGVWPGPVTSPTMVF